MYYYIHQRTEMLYSAPIYQSAIGVDDGDVADGEGERADGEGAPGRGRPADGLLQHPPGSSDPPPAADPPGDEGADRPRGARADFPDGDHPAGGLHEPVRADPGGGARGVPAAPPPPPPRARAPAA